jgi:hypothetical protein
VLKAGWADEVKRLHSMSAKGSKGEILVRLAHFRVTPGIDCC